MIKFERHLFIYFRYACTVCGHRPVFDTVDMLAIHRQGKKHKKCKHVFSFIRDKDIRLLNLNKKYYVASLK